MPIMLDDWDLLRDIPAFRVLLENGGADAALANLQSIDLMGVRLANLHGYAWDAFCRKLLKCRNLQSIDLRDGALENLNEQRWRDLVTVLQRCTHLQHVLGVENISHYRLAQLYLSPTSNFIVNLPNQLNASMALQNRSILLYWYASILRFLRSANIPTDILINSILPFVAPALQENKIIKLLLEKIPAEFISFDRYKPEIHGKPEDKIIRFKPLLICWDEQKAKDGERLLVLATQSDALPQQTLPQRQRQKNACCVIA